MTVARMAEMGMPENTRYDVITAARIGTETRLLAAHDFKIAAKRPVTITRWAPETATRCARPHAWKPA